MAARVNGLERLKAKISRLPPNVKKKMKALNEASARKMLGGARLALTRGDPERGHLEDTLVIEDGKTETGVLVRVGSPEQPYPLHLEAGHKAPDGSHVPPQPFWYPTKRRVAKAHKRESKKILSAVVDEAGD